MITDTELQSLEEIASKEPLVGKLLDAYNDLVSDPAEIFRSALSKTALHLASEMNDATEGNILKGEDKTFERISVLLKEGERILGGLSRTSGVEDKIADKKKEKHKGKAVV
jgi:hypothetical protein